MDLVTDRVSTPSLKPRVYLLTCLEFSLLEVIENSDEQDGNLSKCCQFGRTNTTHVSGTKNGSEYNHPNNMSSVYYRYRFRYHHHHHYYYRL